MTSRQPRMPGPLGPGFVRVLKRARLRLPCSPGLWQFRNREQHEVMLREDYQPAGPANPADPRLAHGVAEQRPPQPEDLVACQVESDTKGKVAFVFRGPPVPVPELPTGGWRLLKTPEELLAEANDALNEVREYKDTWPPLSPGMSRGEFRPLY